MTGFALGIAAAFATALSHALAKGSLDRQDLSAFLIVRSGTAVLVMGGVVAVGGYGHELLTLAPGVAARLVGVGVLAPLAVNLLYFRALRRVPVNIAVPVYQCYPAISFVLGLGLLKLKVDLTQLAGLAMVVVGAAGFCNRASGPSGSRHALDRRGVAVLLLASCLMASATVAWKAIGRQASPPVLPYQWRA